MAHFFKDGNTFNWLDANTFSYLSDIASGHLDTPTGTVLLKADAPLDTTADKENASFPATNCNVINDQYLEYLSTDATDTVLTVVFLEPINVLFLANINFASFKVTVNAAEETFTAFKNGLTGRYNGVCFFDGDVNSLTITITTQTPVDSASYFSIGAICGGEKVQVNPRYNAGRTVKEPSEILRFDRNNKEVNNTGRPYHEFNINYQDLITTSDISSLKGVVSDVGMSGTIIVYEYYTDRETGILGEITGTFDVAENAETHFDSILRVKEKV